MKFIRDGNQRQKKYALKVSRNLPSGPIETVIKTDICGRISKWLGGE